MNTIPDRSGIAAVGIVAKEGISARDTLRAPEFMG